MLLNNSTQSITPHLSVRLHMLCELEHSFRNLLQQWQAAHLEGIQRKGCTEEQQNWDARLLMTQNSFRAKEPILALRRALLNLSNE